MILRLFLFLGLSVFLAACTSSPPQSIDKRLADRGYTLGEGEQSIPRFRVSNWNYLDERHLIVRSGVRDHFMIELMQPCFGLDSAFGIGFATPTSRVDRFGSILVRGIDGRRERCRIQNIYSLAAV